MKKLENQKEIIFHTAKSILTGDEVEKFSIRMISRQCNIGMGTIYKYYGNKDDILLDIIRDLWMSYIQEVRSTNRTFDQFIIYIEYLFEELKKYSEEFNYLTLSKELSSSIRKEGRNRHVKAQEVFIQLIKEKLDSFYIVEEDKSRVLATFISNNLIAMITNDGYEFFVFASVISEILEQLKEKR